MTDEIQLHAQLALAHQQLAQAKVEILRLHEELERNISTYKENIESANQQLNKLKQTMHKTSLPMTIPYLKTMRDEGFDFVEDLPEDLETIRGIGPDKALKITDFLQNGTTKQR